MAPPQLTVGRYNPNAYVPGGASPRVAGAIQAKGFTPYNPGAYVPGGAPLNVAKAIQQKGFGFGGGPLITAPTRTAGTTPAVIPTVAPITTTGSTRPKNPYGETAPDLQALIAGDWETQDAETNAASRMKTLRDQLTMNLRRALIDLGARDTSQLGKFGSYIDQGTLTQAIGNKYSANAQISRQQQLQNEQMEASLAARGGLSSGQLSKSAGDIAEEAESSRYKALQDYLGGAEEGLTGLGNAEFDLGQTIARARAAAAQRAAEYDLAWRGWNAANPETTTTPGPAPVVPHPNVINIPAPPGTPYDDLTRGYVVGGRVRRPGA